LSSLDHPKLKVFGGSLEMHLENSSKDGRQWHPQTSQSEAWGKGSFKQTLSVKSTHTRHFPLFFFTTTVLANYLG